MRKKVIAGNWKMNKTSVEAKEFIRNLKNITIDDDTEAIICAPFPYLQLLVDETEETSIKIAAQNMHEATEGAFTGEVSPVMLNDLRISHVVIGHSERRQYFNETDKTVNKKVVAAHAYQITPIVCVGESLEQREANQTLSIIEQQVTAALSGLTEQQIGQTIIAYEPIWAIGTGKTASSADANEVCRHIRDVIKKISTASVANQVIIQYGGSVNEDNINELLQTEHIDGALVGGASLDVQSFTKLLQVKG